MKREAKIDLGVLALLVLINPVLWLFDQSAGRISPDAVGYATLARNLFDTGALFVPHHGSFGSGLILPPLYPALCAVGNLFHNEPFAVAEYVSALAAILLCVPLYLVLRRTAPVWLAAATLVLVQIGRHYVEMSLSPLTESLFMLVVACTLFATVRLTERPTPARALITGACCALAFLTRHVGLATLPFALAWLLLSRRKRGEGIEPKVGRSMGWLVAAFVAVCLPYSAALYHQTGHLPFTQHFSVIRHTATADDDAEKMLSMLLSKPTKTYEEKYARRRLLRRLTPDASAMYSSLRRKGTNDKPADVLPDIAPARSAGAFVDSFGHLRTGLGTPLLILFLLSAALPVVALARRKLALSDYPTLGLVATYLVLLALLPWTSTVDRYFFVLVPFCLVQIGASAAVAVRWIRVPARARRFVTPSLAAVLLLVGIVTLPSYRGLDLSDKVVTRTAELDALRAHIRPGEPVFSLFPRDSFLIGGSHRVLPNDSLQRISEYGRRTGVRWLLHVRTGDTDAEASFYVFAPWYLQSSPPNRLPPPAHYCCSAYSGFFALYRLDWPEPATPAPTR